METKTVTDDAIKQELAYLRMKLDQMSDTTHMIDKRLVVIETRAAVIGSLAGLVASAVVSIVIGLWG